MAARKPQIAIHRFLKCTIGGLACRFLGFSSACYAPAAGPMLIVSNHNADLDPVFLSMAFQEHMYFVASEHIFRWGFWSRLIVALFDPISRSKGMTDARAALQILRRLKNGSNVCLFAEGNRSYSGVTGPIFAATGKLARASRASLVTYRIRGGYLATPRWALTRRHGPVHGELVQVYSPEQLRAMTDEQVNAAIAADLYEDAFERQACDMQPYTGKRLAEGVEYALYLCPCCGGIGTLHGEGDTLVCRGCGLRARYTEYGFFEGEDAPFSNMRDWDAWQDAELSRRMEQAAETPERTFFSDPEQTLLLIDQAHGSRRVDRGTLSVNMRTLSVGKTAFPLENIADMAVCGRGKLVFSSGAEQYEISSKPPCCGRKYTAFLQKWRELR